MCGLYTTLQFLIKGYADNANKRSLALRIEGSEKRTGQISRPEEKGFCYREAERIYLALRELARYGEEGPLTLESILEEPDRYVIVHEECLLDREERSSRIPLPDPDADPVEDTFLTRKKPRERGYKERGPEDILPMSMRRKLKETAPVEDEPMGDVGRKDLEFTLSRYHREGLIVLEDGKVTVTSRGARVLARGVLQRLIGNLGQNITGWHKPPPLKEGVVPTTSNRRYESGDDYSSLDIENTLLNALGRAERMGKIGFRTEDFRVHEMTSETKLIAGLMIDTSMSMQMKGIMDTARDTSLALAELIGERPDHSLKVYLFADHAKEVPPWEIFRHSFPGGLTDICAPLEKFRKEVRFMEGNKQAYLITDSVSNLKEGRLVGFEEAAPSLLAEALRYRKEKIVLNIVMLEEEKRFKEFAIKLAQRSGGRVFFVSPDNLAQTIVRDYFRYL